MRPTKEQWQQFNKHHFTEELVKIPIKRGCSNKSCFCTGKCEEIIGYREPHPLEKTKWLFNGMSKDEIRNGHEEVQRELKEKTNE